MLYVFGLMTVGGVAFAMYATLKHPNTPLKHLGAVVTVVGAIAFGLALLPD